MKQAFHSIPGKMDSFWLSEQRSMLDVWTNYFITLEQFQSAVMAKGLEFSKKNGGRAWIVDSSHAKGVFPEEIQNYIGATAFKEFVGAGVKFFITIRSKSSTTNMSIARYERQAGPAGISLVTVDSIEQALAFLDDVDAGRAAA